MNRLVLIISSSLRHLYFAKKINDQLKGCVVKIYIETTADFSESHLSNKENQNMIDIHFIQRYNSEIDFFSDASDILEEKQKLKLINKGAINNENIVSEIEKINPTLILTYGCSIIRKPLLMLFEKKIINIHLGISPYYLGAGTNFHALVNNEFQFFGYSIIYMDQGIDTGEIIHQSRAEFFDNDTPHSAGNRLIKKMVNDLIKVVLNFESLEEHSKIITDYKSKKFKIIDSDIYKVKNLYKNFHLNLKNYIKKRDDLDQKFPIIKQKFSSP